MPNPFLEGNEPESEAYDAWHGITDGERGVYAPEWIDAIALRAWYMPNHSVPRGLIDSQAVNLPSQVWGYGWISDWNGEIGEDRPAPETNRFPDASPIRDSNWQSLPGLDVAPELLEENTAIMDTSLQPAFEFPPAFASYLGES